MQSFIAKIGRGQKTSKDLTWEESKQAMRLLIEGRATPEQVGAFLLAMRLKMESVTELAAFTSVAREYVPAVALPRGLPVVDLPLYSGKKETFHASVGAAIVAAAGGANIFMHGYESTPERRGVISLLASLGIATEHNPTQVGDQVASLGFGYLNIANYHPPVARFLSLRQELGLRNFFHPVVKMLNPARAQSQVLGISHPPYFEKIAEALIMLSCQKALILRGVEGEPEISLASSTRVLEVGNGRVSPLTLHPKDVGITLGTFQEMAGYPPTHLEKEAALLRRILNNEVRGGPREWVKINAAMLLYAAGKASSIRAAMPQATQALDSGEASKKLEELVNASRETTKGVGGPLDLPISDNTPSSPSTSTSEVVTL